MRHDYLNNVPLSEAVDLFLREAEKNGFSAGSELVETSRAAGRYTSEAVYARICAPHYNACAMDGIAVKASDTFGAAENSPVTLSPGSYDVVDTGDPLPAGRDAVIMIEDVREDDNGGVRIFSSVAPWHNVRQVGEDMCMGDMIAPQGARVGPALVGAFLAGGVTSLNVKKRPLFAVIPTGDEIVPPTGDPGSGEIIEFNSSVISAQLNEWDADCVISPIVRDDKEMIRETILGYSGYCDAVLVLAGSSAGRDDYTSSVFAQLGTLLLHGAAIKPGKPVALGIVGGKPIVGLPGYPVSAMVVSERFIKPLIDLWYSRRSAGSETARAVLTKRVVSSLKYEEFVRVTLGTVGETCYAVPLPRGAGVITSVTKAGGILHVPQNSEGFEAGEAVEVDLLRPRAEITDTLVITGSHDPLIDEIAQEVSRRGLGFSIVSSHVGSLGAFRAVGAGQAHMGACHLLDEETGEYNVAYLKKYFPDGGASLVGGVYRIQGLMVKKGNPLNIDGIKDLTHVRYVNRQRGAGTRVLLDHLLAKEGISPDDIDGYRNEKYTHSAVAASVAADNADAGMGILSAAKIYDLDFIPLWREKYDFLVADAFADDPKVKAFFDILRSESFARRLGEMGGYVVRGDD